MAVPAVSGASIMCTMGTAPGTLVTTQTKVLFGGAPACSIQDSAPMSNVTPCGMCNSMANPTVAAATAAKLGVFTPMPCVPAPAGIWVCPGKVIVGGAAPTLTTDGKLICSYGGNISIANPNQTKVMV